VDRVSKEQRSRIMARIRSCGTAPERKLGELLRALLPGERIEERPASLPGKPDYFLPGLALAVFMDGCFWHGCPKCHRLPEDNRAYWELKLRRNRARDRAVNAALRAAGIAPVRIWEHELAGDGAQAKRKLRRSTRRAQARLARPAAAG